MSSTLESPHNFNLRSYNVFESSIQFAKELGLKAVTLPSEFANKASIKPDSQMTVSSRAWLSREIGLLRTASVSDGEISSIVNCAFFPIEGFSFPIVQSEIVIIKSRLMLLLHDFSVHDKLRSPQIESTCEDILNRLRERYSCFPSVLDRPKWTEGHISKQALWSKPGTSSLVEEGYDSLKAPSKNSLFL